MAARSVPLVGDVLDDLPPRCRSCVFWELGEQRPDDRDRGGERAARDRVRKQGWVTAQSLETGAPGVLLRDGEQTLGFALYAPARAFAERAGTVPATSADALLLATAWVDPNWRGFGHGGLVVQAAVRDAIRLGLTAVEAYGDRRAREWDCVLPAAWLLHEGFEVELEHPRYPLLRLDTRRVARWAETLEHAVEGMLGRARSRPQLQPAPIRSRT